MKILIFGGRVIDPANHIDGQYNILLENGKVAWIGRGVPDAEETIDASGMIVAPGFIDIHMHEDPVAEGKIRQCIFPMMLRQGVTTAVGGNCGGNVHDPVDYLNIVDRDGTAVNVALYAGHEYFRIAAGAEDIYGGATQKQQEAMAAAIRSALDAGCVGVSFGLRYVPGADKAEFFRAAQCCRESRKPIASHVRDDADAVFASIEELLEAGRAFGIPMQISHIGSMAGFGQMEAVLRQVDAACREGLDVTLDCYPYFAFSTRLGTPTYDPGWLRRYHCGYDVLEFCDGKYRGQRATEKTFHEVRTEFPECLTVCYVMQEADIRLAYRHPKVMLGSDGITDNGRGHPRCAGTFPRFLAEFVKKSDLTLYQAIEKMTAMPAKRLGFKNKGHLAVGADGDITIFDMETIQDKATFADPALPPAGIEYVLIGGETVLKHGRILRDTQGKSVRI
ncbi:MAG: amidohydrolase family protein [Oscillospiraceae bacterium]|nr:amidohydrolase family protein [Oscillospiraceae bacterium]